MLKKKNHMYHCVFILSILSSLLLSHPQQGGDPGLGPDLPLQQWELINISQNGVYFDWCSGCFTKPFAFNNAYRLIRGGSTPSTTFMVIFNGDPSQHSIKLVGANWQLLCRDSQPIPSGYGSSSNYFAGLLVGNSDSAPPSCTWTYENLGGGKIAFRADNGAYMYAGAYNPSVMTSWEPNPKYPVMMVGAQSCQQPTAQFTIQQMTSVPIS